MPLPGSLICAQEEEDPDKEEMVDDGKKDAIIDIVGEMGRYQWMVILLFAIMELPHAWTMLMHKFISPEIDHWCASPPHLNWTEKEWRNLSSPPGDSCHVYDRNYTSLLDLKFSEAVQIMDLSTDLVPCTSWDYDNTNFQNTLMQKWDLVCDKKLLPNIASSVYFAGTAVGVFLSGLLADKLGRRPVLLLFMIIFCMSGLVAALSPVFEVWLVARFLWGASTLGIRSVKTVMSLEMVGSAWRAVVGVGLIEGFWSLGYLTLPLVSYLLPDASHLMLATALVMLPAIGFVYMISESPRWLLATGRRHKCRESLQTILRVNKVDKEFSLDEDMSTADSGQKADCIDLFRTPMLRRNTIVMSVVWFSLGSLYFGLSLNMPEFDANIYFIFFLSGLVEVPAAFITPILLNKFGRRPTLVSHFVIGGALCIATAVVPLGVFSFEWPIVVLAMLGKYVSQAGWGTVYVYTTELFPTVVRSAAVSFCCFIARLGSIISPFIASLKYIDPVLPIIVFGSMTLIAGTQAVLLAETNKKKLPATLQDGEEFLRKNSYTFSKYTPIQGRHNSENDVKN